MKRFVVFTYGVLVYVFFLVVFLYAIGFVGNIFVPVSIDSPATAPVGTAILINALVLGLFAVQHTIMARPGFKAMFTRLIPHAAERPTFVLAATLILALVFWQWRPIEGTVWDVQNETGRAVLYGLFALGWGMVLYATFLINHFELFGLAQVTRYLQNKEFTPPPFKERSLYKVVRHPIMLGFIIAFWSTPTMSMGHLFFAGLTTAYILVGLFFEERDLVRAHGARYLEYAGRVPKLIPFGKFGGSSKSGTPELEDEPAA